MRLEPTLYLGLHLLWCLLTHFSFTHFWAAWTHFTFHNICILNKSSFWFLSTFFHAYTYISCVNPLYVCYTFLLETNQFLKACQPTFHTHISAAWTHFYYTRFKSRTPLVTHTLFVQCKPTFDKHLVEICAQHNFLMLVNQLFIHTNIWSAWTDFTFNTHLFKLCAQNKSLFDTYEYDQCSFIACTSGRQMLNTNCETSKPRRGIICIWYLVHS